MMSWQRIAHAAFLFALPMIVAWFGLSFVSAALLVVAVLAWRWAINIAPVFVRGKDSKLVLETIAMSHFAEKARWCLDRLGVDYEERISAGVVGAMFLGRTVPRLTLQTGIVRSSIGHSPEILRFLWGEYGARLGADSAFLETSPERLELERRIDRYGVDLQIWIYYHLLLHRELTLHLWGVNHPQVPAWQKPLIRVLYPLIAAFVRKTFSVDDAHYAKAVEHIDQMLGDIDTRLADGRKSILGGDELNYVDLTFAAISGLWLQPDKYGGAASDGSRVARNRLPSPMQADIQRWSEDYPRACAFVARLYAEERSQ